MYPRSLFPCCQLEAQKAQMDRRIRQLEAEVPAGFSSKAARLGLAGDRGADYRARRANFSRLAHPAAAFSAVAKIFIPARVLLCHAIP